MSTAVLFDPHGDDGPLFAAYSLLSHDDVTVFVDYPTVPWKEVKEAYKELGAHVTYEESVPQWPDVVYAPNPHGDGHEEHNQVAQDVIDYWHGRVPIVYYETYAPRGQRTRTANEVPYEPWMVAAKLRALGCFVSQIEQESTRPWFTSLLDVREWYA